MKKTILSVILATLTLSVYSQVQNQNDFLPYDKVQMDDLLSKEQYTEFYELLKKNLNSKKISNENYINYLLSKKDDGHVPLYWMVSDYYANQNDIKNTQKWFYISLIMTQQDAFLCSDTTARDAPRKLKTKFPKAEEISRNNPQNNSAAMSDAFFFIDHLRARSNPSWTCIFGTMKLPPNAKIVADKEFWRPQRQIILNKFKKAAENN